MDQLVNFIIRPPRADYSPKNDLLDQEFMLKGRWFQRKDLEVINGRGNILQCSHYIPLEIPEGKTLPCVIYCHGNSGCRADASEAAIILLPSNITVFTLDFSGSGLSEGEHVTLGWNEKDDLKAVVNYLRTDGNVSCIGLWGRSMGAVTSLRYGAEDPSIAGMVLDSPFSNLVELMMELVDTYKYPLPKFTVKLAIQHMRKVIKKKANFDIMDLDTIQGFLGMCILDWSDGDKVFSELSGADPDGDTSGLLWGILPVWQVPSQTIGRAIPGRLSGCKNRRVNKLGYSRAHRKVRQSGIQDIGQGEPSGPDAAAQ